MSYEGYNQYICKNGHQFTAPENYGCDKDVCVFCKAEPAWRNSVDDTNCNAYGIICDFSSLQIESEEKQICNLGHEHIVKYARYRIPTEKEAKALRHYWDGYKYLPLD